MSEVNPVIYSLPALSQALFNGLLMLLKERKDRHVDKRENAPSIIVHLFEVRLPFNSA